MEFPAREDGGDKPPWDVIPTGCPWQGWNPPWLLADTSLHGVPNQDVRTVVQLHGAAVLPRYHGYPTNWFKSGESDLYFYQNLDLNDDGETLWYHDHAIGVTANEAYAGLAGF